MYYNADKMIQFTENKKWICNNIENVKSELKSVKYFERYLWQC